MGVNLTFIPQPLGVNRMLRIGIRRSHVLIVSFCITPGIAGPCDGVGGDEAGPPAAYENPVIYAPMKIVKMVAPPSWGPQIMSFFGGPSDGRAAVGWNGRPPIARPAPRWGGGLE